MNSKLKILCELYDRSDENVNANALFKACFFKNLEDVLNLLSNKQKVKFAYLCAKSVFHLNNEKTKEKAEKCLELVEEWLENHNSVSNDELRKVAYAAYAIHVATNAAAYAADAAADAYTACYAAYAAAYAAKNKQEQEYKNLCFLVKVIRDES